MYNGIPLDSTPPYCTLRGTLVEAPFSRALLHKDLPCKIRALQLGLGNIMTEGGVVHKGEKIQNIY